MGMLKNFIRWCCWWKNGSRKVKETVGQIEGLVANLVSGIELLEIEANENTLSIEKKRIALQKFETDTNNRIASIQALVVIGSNAKNGFTAILQGDLVPSVPVEEEEMTETTSEDMPEDTVKYDDLDEDSEPGDEPK